MNTEEIRPRRVLFFGKRKSRSACTGALVDALRANGLEVTWVNCSTIKRWITKVPMRALVRWIYRYYRPDLIFVFFHDLPPVLMREFSTRTPTVVWMEEALQQIRRSQLEYVSNVKLLCLSSPDLVEAYHEIGIPRATFQLSGFSPAIHKPHSSLRKSTTQRSYDRDLAFIGGPGEIEDRTGLLAWLVEQGCDLDVFGCREAWLPYLRKYPNLRFSGEARPPRYAEICARSKIVLGMNQTHESWMYFSNRVFLTLACQGFHLTHYVPGIDKVFDRGKHLDWFQSGEECLERIRHWLDRDDERNEIAAAGREHVLANHTYAHRVAEILQILAGEREIRRSLPEGSTILHPLPSSRYVHGSDAMALPHAADRHDELLAVRVPSAERSKI